MTGISQAEAVTAAEEILAAARADKAEADRHGGSPDCDIAVEAATELHRLVTEH